VKLRHQILLSIYSLEYDVSYSGLQTMQWSRDGLTVQQQLIGRRAVS